MMHIKDWKKAEIIRENGGYIEEVNGAVRETEKAVLVSITIGYTSSLWKNINVWIPKSAMLTDEQYAEQIAEEQKRFDEGCKRYEKLIAFAKENGVKGVRSGMRTETIMKKIESAGLNFVA